MGRYPGVSLRCRVGLSARNESPAQASFPLAIAAVELRPVRGRSSAGFEPAHADVRRSRLDFDNYRRPLWKRGIEPLIARRGVAHGSGMGKTRWVVERTFAWLHQFKRLRLRYERRADLHHGLLQLACCIICLRRLQAPQKDQ